MAKITVRVPVAVDTSGRYYAYGWKNDKSVGPSTLEELLEVVDLDQCGPGEKLYWLVAEVDVPEATEVQAVVSE